jgi:hypothetical protein
MRSQQQKEKSIKTVSKFLYIMAGAYALCIPLLIFLPSYFSFDASESLSIFVKDGWCNPGQGIGLHCFGDFFYTFRYTDLIDPWSHGMNPQPPVGTFFYKIFSWYTVQNPNSKIPILIYLLLCICASLFPAYHLGWRRNSNLKITFLLSIATISFAPLLMALDRGSNQVLIIPFIYLFVTSIIECSNRKTLIYGLALVLIKPQMILLGVIFILNRDIRNATKWGVYSVVITFATFLLYPLAYLKNVRDYFQQVVDYQHYVPAGLVYPANISISNLWSTFHRIYFEIFPTSNHIDNPGSWKFYSPLITICIISLVAIASWKFGPRKTQLTRATVAVSLPALIPNVSFHYYYCVFLTCYLLVLLKGISGTTLHENKLIEYTKYETTGFTIGKIRTGLALASALFLFVPWPLPWSILSPKLPFLISSTWLMGQITLTLLIGILIFSSTTENSETLDLGDMK